MTIRHPGPLCGLLMVGALLANPCIWIVAQDIVGGADSTSDLIGGSVAVLSTPLIARRRAVRIEARQSEPRRRVVASAHAPSQREGAGEARPAGGSRPAANAEVAFQRGDAALEQGDYARAVEQFQLALRGKPRWAEAQNGLGDAFYNLN